MENYHDDIHGILTPEGFLRRSAEIRLLSYHTVKRTKNWQEDEWYAYFNLHHRLDYYHRYDNTPNPKDCDIIHGEDARFIQEDESRFETRYDYLILDPVKINNDNFEAIIEALTCLIPELENYFGFVEVAKQLDRYIILKFEVALRGVPYCLHPDLKWAKETLAASMDFDQKYLHIGCWDCEYEME